MYDTIFPFPGKPSISNKRGGEGSFDVVRVGDVTDGTVQVVDRLIVSDGEELYLKVDGMGKETRSCISASCN